MREEPCVGLLVAPTFENKTRAKQSILEDSLQVEGVAALFVAVRELLAIVAAGVALCSLDDLLIDLLYLTRLIWRRLTVYRRFARATVAHFPAKSPAPMAVLVPAWNESAVIGAMLRDLLARLD